MHEVLAAGVVLLGYYSLSTGQSCSGFDSLTEQFLEKLDLPGWQGMGYVSPVDARGRALSLGAWDSIEVRHNRNLLPSILHTDVVARLAGNLELTIVLPIY